MLRRLALILGLTLVSSSARAQQPYQPYPQQPYPQQPYQPYPQQPGYPPATPPACPPFEEGDDFVLDANGCKKKPDFLERGGIVGLRLAMTSTSGAETNGTFGAAQLGGGSEQFKTTKIWTVHVNGYSHIGGGTAGFEGGFGGGATGGIRVPIASTHGPIARIGIGAELEGNKRFYFSRLALPVAEVGYQYIKAFTVLELGFRGGLNITGRYNTGHRTRRELGDGSLEWGPYLAAHFRHARLDASFTRIEAGDNFPGGPVDLLRGVGCVYASSVGICADAAYLRGDGFFTLPGVAGRIVADDVRSFYGGLTVGLMDP